MTGLTSDLALSYVNSPDMDTPSPFYLFLIGTAQAYVAQAECIGLE